ncbi:unnamed protein product, partial [Bacillus thuringiensis DB27]
MTIGHFPSTSIANNIKEVQSIFHHASDLIIQNIHVKEGTLYSSVLYLDSLTNKEFL